MLLKTTAKLWVWFPIAFLEAEQLMCGVIAKKCCFNTTVAEVLQCWSVVDFSVMWRFVGTRYSSVSKRSLVLHGCLLIILSVLVGRRFPCYGQPDRAGEQNTAWTDGGGETERKTTRTWWPAQWDCSGMYCDTVVLFEAASFLFSGSCRCFFLLTTFIVCSFLFQRRLLEKDGPANGSKS